jgi:hypothetical protein
MPLSRVVGYRPQSPVLSALCPQLNLLKPPPNKIPGWVRHCRDVSTFLMAANGSTLDVHRETVQNFESKYIFRPVLYCVIQRVICNVPALNRRPDSYCCSGSMRRVSSVFGTMTIQLCRPSKKKWLTGDCRGRRIGTWRRAAQYCTHVCGVCRATSLLSDFLLS